MNRPAINMPEAFKGLMTPMRLKGFYGGRGGAKSESACAALLALGAVKPLKILCGREYQNSIADSVKSLLDTKVQALGLGGFSSLGHFLRYSSVLDRRLCGSLFHLLWLRCA